MTGPLYDTTERLPTPTGGDAQAQFGQMKARLVARYKLVAVPGRPEELISPETEEGALSRGVSLGYGCRSIRVRLMAGRDWIRTEDFQIQADWRVRLFEMCDTYFNYVGPDNINRKTGFHGDNIMSFGAASRPPDYSTPPTPTNSKAWPYHNNVT